jgi:hypothetical protein
MNITTKLLDSNAASVTAGTTIFEPARLRDEQGLFQVKLPATFAGTVSLYGRIAPDAPWHEITNQVIGDMVVNNTNTVVVDMFPYMSIGMTGNGTAVQVEAWLMS